MEDARITKTKLALKRGLVELLQSHSFDEITVTDICTTANVSRITFYKHFEDKYNLVVVMFEDLTAEGDAIYRNLEEANNPSRDIHQGFINVITATLQVINQYIDFFRQVSPGKNPFLTSTFFALVLRTVESYTIKESYTHKLNYTAAQITGFLCYGLAGFILESEAEAFPVIQKDVERLARGLLASNVLFSLN